jgi:hypothetical protein
MSYESFNPFNGELLKIFDETIFTYNSPDKRSGGLKETREMLDFRNELIPIQKINEAATR